MDDYTLEEGEYRGYKWIIERGIGPYRNGYILIPKGHPFHGKSCRNLNSLGVEVHGGLTFAYFIEDDYYIGFDCSHIDDLPDPMLPDERPSSVKKFLDMADTLGVLIGEEPLTGEKSIKTMEFVEKEIKKLIDQIITLSMRGS